MPFEIKPATRTCAVPDCSKPYSRHGYCSGHYSRLYKHGEPQIQIPLLARHGEGRLGHRTPEYTAWIGIRDRCLNAKSPAFNRYGGRGIKLCERWLNSYQNFLQDMGRKPSLHHTVERIDNNGNYCPENCRWATRKEQANNTRRNRWLEFDGRRLTVAQWAREVGISERTLHNRISAGYSIHESLTRPVGRWAGFRKTQKP